jgi:hypothetical protein
MKVDYPGSIVPFKDAKAGAFFAHFAGGALGVAMKIQTSAMPPAIAVLSFSDSPHPTISPPSVLETTQFDNRDVLVFEGAVLRPNRDMKALADGSPPHRDQSVGAVILTEGSVLIRAFNQGGLWDINFATGAARTMTAHPGSMWIDDWEIVLPQPGADIVLCRREKPAAPPTGR